MSINLLGLDLSTPMPGTLPDVSTLATEVPAAEGAVVLDSAAVELATLVFDFISRFSSFSNIVVPEVAKTPLEAETPSETENSQPDSETIAKNDFLDSLAEVFKYTTNTISDVFQPILEKLGNLAHLIFKNLSNSEPAKPTATAAHTPSHRGEIGSPLVPQGTSSRGHVGSSLVPLTNFSGRLPGCSLFGRG